MNTILLSLALGACLSSVVFAQARPPIPSVVLDHMNDLDRRCVAAGGRAGEGRFVVAQDFTGDGRLDYLLSEGDYNCVGRPGLFRKGGVARVDLFVVDARNAARRVYSDQLIGCRVLAGQPANVQIARQGAAYGPLPIPAVARVRATAPTPRSSGTRSAQPLSTPGTRARSSSRCRSRRRPRPA